MQVKIERASDWNYKENKNFKNWNQAIDYMQKTDSKWVLNFENKDLPVLTIYDSRME